jgi:methyl-accepting chemotaxis protein
MTTASSRIQVFGVSSTNLTRQLVLQSGVGEAELLGNVLYGPTRFDDAAAASQLLESTMNSSNGAAVGAVVVKLDGTTVTVNGTPAADLDALAGAMQTILQQGADGTVTVGNYILVPIRKSGADADGAVGLLGLDWRADTAVATLVGAEKQALLYSVVVAAIVIGLVILGSRYLIIRPLNVQRDTIQRISQGELQAAVQQGDRNDEIGEIARSTDDLRQKLLVAAADQKDAAYKGAAFTAASSAMMMTCAEYRIRYVNPAMIDLLGKFKEFIPQLSDGVTIEKITNMSLDDFHSNGTQIRSRLQGMGDQSINVMIAFGDSRVSLRLSQVLDKDGQGIGIIMEWSDITAEWLNDAILQGLDNQQLRADFDTDGRIISANVNMCQALGATKKDIAGRNLSTFILEGEADEPSAEAIKSLAAEKGLFAGRLALVAVDGKKIIADGSLSCVRDGAGAPVRYILLVRESYD